MFTINKRTINKRHCDTMLDFVMAALCCIEASPTDKKRKDVLTHLSSFASALVEPDVQKSKL